MSRSEHHGNDHNYEKGWGDHIEWDTPRSRALATREYGRLMIAEGLAEMVEDRAIDWWAWTEERAVEAAVIERNLDNARLMEDLADMTPAQRTLLERDGHSNLLPFRPRGPRPARPRYNANPFLHKTA